MLKSTSTYQIENTLETGYWNKPLTFAIPDREKKPFYTAATRSRTHIKTTKPKHTTENGHRTHGHHNKPASRNGQHHHPIPTTPQKTKSLPLPKLQHNQTHNPNIPHPPQPTLGLHPPASPPTQPIPTNNIASRPRHSPPPAHPSPAHLPRLARRRDSYRCLETRL
jgi:hypothetical protein